MNKLKNLKEKIRIWARLHKESLNIRKSILKAELADLDGVIDKGEGSDVDGHQRREVVRLIQEVEKVDAMEVAQKAKIKWSIEGDENSKYYHDGIWMESPHLVKHEFFEHFKNRFEKPNKSRILLERDFVKRISLEQNDDLEREVSNEEIKRAIWDCGIDKAPGPDGFTYFFYRRYWDIIGNDVVDAVKWFICMERFRKENKKKQYMIFKVDFEKAYDSVRWDFIDDILRRFSFEEKWCLFNGIKLDSSLQISHLFYADDVIFMGQWSQCNIDTIIRVLDMFYRSSGLRINVNKSNLMGIFVDSNKVKHAAAKIGAIPIYHMSIFKVPMKVLQNIESIRARFFNDADVNSKKPSWVRWKSVLAAKDVGGLENSLWVRVVKALHGEDGKIGKKVQPMYPSTWLNIINEIESLKFHGIDLVSFITLKLVGSGDFSVSSVRKLIDNDILPKGISKTRWIKEVPIKINVHAWKVIHDCLPTRFNISRRGRSILLNIGVNGSHPSGSR
nr:RNA-directed DNA polymerase, eukaryota, reverse transcriptase zinc-binding domain protein [Tanacetum cinerariifolium]